MYLKRGLGREAKEAWGHDLGELFMQWDEQGRSTAELAYQNHVWQDLMMNRIRLAGVMHFFAAIHFSQRNR